MNKWREYLTCQAGATMITVALLMTSLFAVIALSVNIGYRHVTKNELQNIADGAALAAARQLGVIYQGISYDDQQNYNPSTDDGDGDGTIDGIQIVDVAQYLGLQNSAASKSIIIDPDYVDPDSGFNDIAIGKWSKGVFNQEDVHPNAVQVVARREAGNNDPISTFFAWAAGVDEVGVKATAVAALTGQSTTVPGELELPVGISEYWFEYYKSIGEDTCGKEITFSPTGTLTGCAGWTSFDMGANQPSLQTILDEYYKNTDPLQPYVSPGFIGGVDSSEFMGGMVDNLFDNLLRLYQRKGWDIDQNGVAIDDVDLDGDGEPEHWLPANYGGRARQLCEYDPTPDSDPKDKYVDVCDGDSLISQEELLYPETDPDNPLTTPDLRNEHVWETTIMVYDYSALSDPCANPNTLLPVVGFTRIRLTNVSKQLISGSILCDYVDNADSRGGGGEAFGLMGSIPGLVF